MQGFRVPRFNGLETIGLPHKYKPANIGERVVIYDLLFPVYPGCGYFDLKQVQQIGRIFYFGLWLLNYTLPDRLF
jgi:hypothetical protein